MVGPEAYYHIRNIEAGYLLLDEEPIDSENFDRIHTEEAVKQRGEVFTPTPLVNEMLDKLNEYSPEVFKDKTKTFLDDSCGNGQFLAVVLERKMANGIEHIDALRTIYGVDIDQNNVDECRRRLALGSDNPELLEVLEHNIICADALDPFHIAWKNIGYMWNENKKWKVITDFFDGID
jgi:SAM-dependent methyltransferase